MAEVDYLRYAQLMGQRNPVGEGLAQLGQTLDDNRRYDLQKQQILRQNRLADMQLQQGQMTLDEAKRKQDAREQLRTGLAGLQPTSNPAFQAQQAAHTPEALNYDRMTPAARQFAQTEAGPGSDVVKGQRDLAVASAPAKAPAVAPDPIPLILDYAIRTGNYDEAKNAVSLDGIMRKRQAEASAYGDLATADKLEVEISRIDKIGSMVKKLREADKTGGLVKEYVTAHPEIFQGIDPSKIGVQNDMVEMKGAGYTLVVGPDGKSHIVKDANETKGFDTVDMGDRIKYIPRDGSPAYYEKKGITPGAAARITINQGGGDSEDVAAWAKAVKEGRANLADVPNRGTVRSRVVKMIEQGGGADYAANKSDNAGFNASITQQQKQVGAMGSFVKNMDSQISKVSELSKRLSTFDTRLLNVPLRAVRGRIAGSADQAKYDMYLTEIESEIGKLATGSAGSVSELSVGAQQKWEKIHDKNLSIKDMLSLLQETREAGKLRMKSVQDQLGETRSQMRNRGGTTTPPKANKDPLGIL